MMTYTAINYCYFALAMTYEKRHERTEKIKQGSIQQKGDNLSKKGVAGYGSTGIAGKTTVRPKDSFEKFASDLDKLFPERLTQRGQHHLIRHNSGSNATTPEADFDATKKTKSMDSFSEQNDTSSLIPADKTANDEIAEGIYIVNFFVHISQIF